MTRQKRLTVLFFLSAVVGCSRSAPTESGLDRSPRAGSARPVAAEKREPAPPKPARTRPEARELNLTAAKEISGAFHKNPITANEKYTGSEWTFTADISSIHDRVTNGRVLVMARVRLDTAIVVDVVLRLSAADVKKVERGQRARFRGKLVEYIYDAEPGEPRYVFIPAELLAERDAPR